MFKYYDETSDTNDANGKSDKATSQKGKHAQTTPLSMWQIPRRVNECEQNRRTERHFGAERER